MVCENLNLFSIGIYSKQLVQHLGRDVSHEKVESQTISVFRFEYIFKENNGTGLQRVQLGAQLETAPG